MRILLAHNFYRAAIPSGENVMVRAEAQLLRDRGHEVRELTRSNDEERQAPLRTRAEAALFMPWNPRSAARMRSEIATFRPDVVHIHNTFPLLSPSIVVAAAESGVPVVATLHNYRLFCAAGVLLRDGQPCTLCIDRHSALPGLVHACYANSRLKTLPLTATIAWHRRLQTWERHVRAFLAVSQYQKEQLVRGGLPADKVQVKPNCTAPSDRVVAWREREDRAIFIGRLTAEKGCDTLIRAWGAWGNGAPLLHIVGDGPMRGSLEILARELRIDGRIRFRGQLEAAQVREELAATKLILQPARWPETFGLTVIEAFAAGVPAAASRIGALQEIVREAHDGVLFEAGNAEALLHTVRSAWTEPRLLERLSANALARHREDFSPEASYAALMRAYEATRSA